MLFMYVSQPNTTSLLTSMKAGTLSLYVINRISASSLLSERNKLKEND